MHTQADMMPNKLRILIVDDEPLNSKLLAAHLVNDPYEIIKVDNGQACLQKLAREPFDLVLLDVMMPKMNGFDVCRHIKQNPATKDLPVIFITSLIDPEHKQSGFDAGGVDYIVKPFDVCEVKARIKTHLALKVARDELSNQNVLLDEKVRERTAELAEININLKEEMAARQQAHDRLRVSEAKIRAMLTAMPDKVHHISKQGNILECTGNVELFGDSAKNVKGKNIGRLLPQDIADAVRRQIAAALQSNDIAVSEHQVSTSKGRRIFEIRMVKIANDEVLAITRDITEKKQAEETLLESEAHLRQENTRLKSSIKERYRFGDIIGKSAPMQQVYDLILEAAETGAGVIIYGESGTGKELVARAIHNMSGRVKHAFVPVNSGAIPENLLESEFFGYKKGAFTGATTDKHGFFDVADGGTMFLDEIGEIGLTMQVKLLRAIENGEYTPVGSSHTAKADVRIIAATNKDLPQLVKEGAIREDFFYRIHIIPIHLPPLRQRKEDLPLLIEHFLKNSENGVNSATPITGKIFDALSNYDWPGNIRELQNTLQRFATLKKLDFMGAAPTDSNKPDLIVDSDPMPDISDYRAAMESYEKKLILAALEKHQWHREKAAASLSLPRRTFFRKLRNFELISA